MADGSSWKTFFLNWSSDMPRRGVLVTTFNEQVPFSNFLTSETMLLLERSTPDSLGARMIVLTYDAVAAVKITDAIKAKALRDAGFSGPMPKG
jgi:hypothetical protein